MTTFSKTYVSKGVGDNSMDTIVHISPDGVKTKFYIDSEHHDTFETAYINCSDTLRLKRLYSDPLELPLILRFTKHGTHNIDELIKCIEECVMIDGVQKSDIENYIIIDDKEYVIFIYPDILLTDGPTVILARAMVNMYYADSPIAKYYNLDLTEHTEYVPLLHTLTTPDSHITMKTSGVNSVTDKIKDLLFSYYRKLHKKTVHIRY